jgi:bifunctional DNA-binding transcriptional regulator/antitoxin component of YhaV-PrlF toxin-antitoxin module
MKTMYNQEEIFQDIPGDSDQVMMKIPDEIAEAAGIKPGDTIKVSWGDQGTIIITKVDDAEEQ